MITTVTMNPCIDKTICVEGFAYGGTNRVVSTRTDAAGKGLNVSLALAGIGIHSKAISFSFSESAGVLERVLERGRIDAMLVPASGALRTNCKLFETGARVMTELNERGTAINAAALSAIRTAILRAAQSAVFLVLSGSLPPGVPDSFYRDIMREAARPFLRFAVDTSGNALKQALSAGPYIVKPNLDELEQFAERPLQTREEQLRAAREVLSRGAQVCCLSLGAQGAMLVTKTAALFAEALPVEVKSVQGAGDSMLAGLLTAAADDASAKEMLRRGVALASATIMHEGTQFGTLADYKRLLEQVRITQI